MRNMTWLPHHSLTVLLAALLAVLSACSYAAETITFKFAPPEGTTFIKTTTGANSMQSGIRSTVDKQKATGRYCLTKTPTGYQATVIPLSIDMIRDGKALLTPLTDALKGATFTQKFSNTGMLLNVTGYEAVIKKVKASLDPAAAEQFSRMVSVNDLVENDKMEWNTRYGKLGGRSMAFGGTRADVISVSLPINITAPAYMVEQLVERTKVDGHTCVRIKYVFSNSADEVTKQFGDALDPSFAELKLTEIFDFPPNANLAITGQGEYLLDPTTLLPYGDSFTRTATLTITTPEGEEQTIIMKQAREYKYRYEK